MASSNYDYIIVGAGSAGCAIAHRLSELSHINVLLLEAGGPDTNDFIHIPLGFGKLIGTDVDWGYKSQPMKHANNR